MGNWRVRNPGGLHSWVGLTFVGLTSGPDQIFMMEGQKKKKEEEEEGKKKHPMVQARGEKETL